jgi:predicted nucleic acid-binding protein
MELARAAGELRSQYRLKTPDSLLAATALYTRTTLVTRNTADFRRVSTLKLWEL